MNLEVVKVRARPGADAGAVAPFAAPAAEQVDETARYVAALLSLARTPRATTDLARVASDVVTLLAPAALHDAVRLETAGERSCIVGADAVAVRLAVVTAILAVLEGSRATDSAATMVGSAGVDHASDLSRVVRCTTSSEPHPAFVIAPRTGATMAPLVVGALADAGITVNADGDVLRLALPAPQAP